ncbi:MAG: DUF4833 domain-containing protein [Bacteroidetes bacterium]|nr:DUF4833 domain-containing protein [Bacteroidota bacterium]
MKSESKFAFPSKNFRKLLVAIFALVSFSSFATENKGFDNEISLFKIERNRDCDEVIYNVKITDNRIRRCKNPLHIFWQLNSGNSETKPLTLIQKKYGYGVNITKELPNEIHFTIAALPNQPFIVKEIKSGTLKAFTNIDNQEIAVNSISISFVEGTKWTAEISYVQLNGTDADTNKEIEKIIQP